MNSIRGTPLRQSPIQLGNKPDGEPSEEAGPLFEILQGLVLSGIGASLVSEALDAFKATMRTDDAEKINPNPVAQLNPSLWFKPR